MNAAKGCLTIIADNIEALCTYKINHLIPAHCTGLKATIRMQKELGKMVEFSHIGYTFAF
jgi:metal-dependent hydrolase (beta-lactamase superfamily II)